jgi:hypothetical protein
MSRELIVELAYWIPLVALLASSLGLIALKRVSGLPGWLDRVAAPPFYFVSLPIATLLAGMEMLSEILLVIYHQISFLIFVLGLPILLCFDTSPLADRLAFANFLLAPFGASFVSGYLLWLSVRRGDELNRASGAERKLRALLLVLIFGWAFLSLRHELLVLAGRFYHPRIL